MINSKYNIHLINYKHTDTVILYHHLEHNVQPPKRNQQTSKTLQKLYMPTTGVLTQRPSKTRLNNNVQLTKKICLQNFWQSVFHIDDGISLDMVVFLPILRSCLAAYFNKWYTTYSFSTGFSWRAPVLYLNNLILCPVLVWVLLGVITDSSIKYQTQISRILIRNNTI